MLRRIGRCWMILVCILIHFVAFIINYAMNGAIDMYTRNYGNLVLYFIESIFGSLACIFICEMVCDKSFKLVKKFLIWMGNNTIIYYILHTMIYVVLRNGSKIVISKVHSPLLAALFVNPAINVFAAIPLIYFINIAVCKYAPQLVGKNIKKQ